MLDHARRGRPHCHGGRSPAHRRRRRRPSPSDASPSAAPRTGSPTRRRTLLARALDVLAADAPPRSASPACSRCSPGPSAPAGRPSSPTALERRAAVAVARGRGPGGRPRRWPPGSTRPPRARGPSAPPPRPRRSSRSSAASRRRPRRWRTGAPSSARRGADPVGDRRRHYAVLPIPSAGDVVLGFEFAGAADAAAARGAPAADDRPPRGRRPRPRHRPARRTSGSSPMLRARDAERATVRLDRRPRAADAAHRAARLSRADPRRPGRRPGGRARVPRAEPGRSSTRWASSSATCSSCRGSSPGRSSLEIGPFSIAEAARRGRRRRCCRSRSSATSASRPTCRRACGRRPATGAASSRS